MAQNPYIPHTDADIKAMLDRIGVKQLADLYSDVPVSCRKKGAYALPDAMSEQEIRDYFQALDAMNSRLKVSSTSGMST